MNVDIFLNTLADILGEQYGVELEPMETTE